ncbi:MAG TPA: S1 RNA-binding domain-containing protein [Candidatus Polarisedimenticolaceae bacterium]|nr:S1 RNA-binding domain-containing protein [Candidatus Polarisedimenticolaceae bacterium]
MTEEHEHDETPGGEIAPPPAAVEQADGGPAEPSPAEAVAGPEGGADGEAGAPAAAKPAKKDAPRRPRDPAVIRAFRAGHPMEGLVEKVIKGGYEIRIGKCRGFCPHSQMDIHRVENPEEHVGKTHAFKILQLRRGGEDVVLSRRALLEADHEEEMKSVRATLIEGAVMTGRVARLTEFGAFVDLGAGVTGLVHLTELAHGRVVRASDIVALGDRVPVKIIKLDEASGKISLSIKQAITDPWDSVPTLFEVGKVYPGKVKRFADFGAFVELRRGIEALAPAREFPPSTGSWREGLEIDAPSEWVVIALDLPRRRITVLPGGEEVAALLASELAPGAKTTGKVVKAEVFGIFVWLGPGRVGMVPRVWSGAGEGAGFESRFVPGSDLPVEVVDVQEGGRRIRLSVQGVDRDAADAARAAAQKPRAERAEGPERQRDRRPVRPERRPPADRPRRNEEPRPAAASSDPGAGFGSHLGEALRAALKRQ